MKRLLLPLLFLFPLAYMNAQENNIITIEQCYRQAESNYPMAKQHELIEKSKQYSIDNISKGIYPQFNVSGAITYQSDVTKIEIPIPGISIPTPAKDQYKLYGELSQSLTDFPQNKLQKQLKEADAGVQHANLNAELYKLRERINNLFFGALMIDEQLKQSDLLKKDIEIGIQQMQAAIDNGTGFRSNVDKLKAELLKVSQKDIELKASRKAYTDMLGLFINKLIDEKTILEQPAAPLFYDSINRPELQVFDLQRQAAMLQRKLIATKSYPKLNAFFQGGIGKPSPVNMLDRGFSPYYITGVRLNWNMGSMYTFKKERLLNENDRKTIDIQQNTFLFNTKVSVTQQQADIVKFEQLIRSDAEIIALRASVKQTSAAQLENGVITTNDYLKEVHEEDAARQSMILHKMQLLMTQYAEKTTTGN